MNILVTGGSGFIGTRLVEELLQLGHEVKIFDLKPSEKFPALSIVGDIRSVSDITTACTCMDVVYNLAAEHRDDVTPVSLYDEVNVQGARNLVQAAEENSVSTIVFTSSVAVYGLDKESPDESFPPEPFNEYGRTKLKAEEIFTEWKKVSSERNLIIFRPAVVFGEGNRGNVYNLISQIHSGRFLMIGSGRNKKSMGYVGNISKLLADQAGRQGHKVYNYCDKPDLSSMEIAQFISTLLDRPVSKVRLPLFVGMLAGYIFDIAALVTRRKFSVSSIRIRKFAAETTISTKALHSDGFVGPYTLEEGLAKMIEADFPNKL